MIIIINVAFKLILKFGLKKRKLIYICKKKTMYVFKIKISAVLFQLKNQLKKRKKKRETIFHNSKAQIPLIFFRQIVFKLMETIESNLRI